MISQHEDALVCDLAETYGIFDYKALPARLIATLAAGLRANSRVKMEMSGAPLETLETLTAAVVDRLGVLVWMNSEDGRKNRNRPKSILESLAQKETKETVFDSPEAFRAAWERNG